MQRFFEELALNAWPALQTQHYDGWILRFAEGYTRRANSISSLYPSSIAVEEKIAHCEQIYRARGLDTVFKLTGAAEPADLDMLLSRSGYTATALTSVQTMEIPDLPDPEIDAVTGCEEVSNDWLEVYCALSERQFVPAMRGVLDAILLPKVFMLLYRNDEPVAAGLSVVERGYVGFYDIITAPAWRNQGLGTQLMLHLLHWGKANGAAHAYLQVMCDNPPAQHLYEKLGFREIYRYWYRAKTRG